MLTRPELEQMYDLPPVPDFGVPGDDIDEWGLSDPGLFRPINFGVED